MRSRAIAQEDLYTLVKEYRQLLDAATTERLPWVDDGSAVYREKVAPLREVSRKLSALLLEPVAPELATHRNLVPDSQRHAALPAHPRPHPGRS